MRVRVTARVRGRVRVRVRRTPGTKSISPSGIRMTLGLGSG